MGKYKNKEIVIEAVQFNGFKKENGQVDLSERPEWITSEFGKKVIFFDKPDTLTIKTLEGNMTANSGDWITKGVNGEFYTCKPDIFGKTYEEIYEEQNQLTERENKLYKIVRTGTASKHFFIYKRYKFLWFTWYDKCFPNLFYSENDAINFLIKTLIQR